MSEISRVAPFGKLNELGQRFRQSLRGHPRGRDGAVDGACGQVAYTFPSPSISKPAPLATKKMARNVPN